MMNNITILGTRQERGRMAKKVSRIRFNFRFNILPTQGAVFHAGTTATILFSGAVTSSVGGMILNY